MKKGSDEKDVFKQKEYVINLLKEQMKKILVVIDDIDQLNNEQIQQVFQLIRSVAKFPNTIYLLVFDKEIVVKALEKVPEGDGENYLVLSVLPLRCIGLLTNAPLFTPCKNKSVGQFVHILRSNNKQESP